MPRKPPPGITGPKNIGQRVCFMLVGVIALALLMEVLVVAAMLIR